MVLSVSAALFVVILSPSSSFVFGPSLTSKNSHPTSLLPPDSLSTNGNYKEHPNINKIMTETSLSSSISSNPSIPCVAQEARSLNLFSTTPLIYSTPLSRVCAPHPVYLKLDLLQPSGSFKDRGMAHLCTTVRRIYGTNCSKLSGSNEEAAAPVTTPQPKMKVISSSGGNAGLAVTTVARNIPDMDVSVVVPKTTKPVVVEKLQSLGADVTVYGENWNEADGLAREWVEKAKNEGSSAVYVSPYDNPLLWTGHSTVVDEIITQFLEVTSDSLAKGEKSNIGAILASVGGGGLLCGILEGLERNYYRGTHVRSDAISGTKVIACETEGTASFAASFHAAPTSKNSLTWKQDLPMVRLNSIDSVATSLGALEVTPAVIHRSHRHQERGSDGGNKESVVSYICTDKEAVDACVKFASDHRMLVEPACGAALAPLYSDRLRAKLLQNLGGNSSRAIVVEVCGGSGVNLDLLNGWKKQLMN